MLRAHSLVAAAVAVFILVVASFCFAQDDRTYLHQGWQLQSACDIKATGEVISKAGFDARQWHKADIPATVVGALITDKTFPEPNYGTNLRDFPGMNYSHKTFFANQNFPKGSPFACAWWFRTAFTIPEGSTAATNIWLHFLGINYRANVWLNGQKIADERDVAGTYRSYEFDVTKVLLPRQTNALALEISAPRKNDLGITWVDWNPTPPDKDMGIWKEVFLTSSGPVAVRNPFISSKVVRRMDFTGGPDVTDSSEALLTVVADLHNASAQPVQGVLNADLEGIKISQPVTLAAGETKTVHFSPENFPELRLTKPRLWWPYTMGEPVMNQAKLEFAIGNAVSDSAKFWFGIRTVTSELTPEGHVLFKINGRNILIRGAAWAPDLFFRWSSPKLQADLEYVRDMGLNAIRLEGRIDREELYERADHLGILIMPGWTCCDAWEKWSDWKEEQHKIAGESLKSVIRVLRKHPSVLVWLNGSDNPPPAAVEQNYLAIEKELDWPNPVISSAADSPTTVTGKSGVKMTGPYEYVPPVYWLADLKAGGAYGYNTETSPGPAIPSRESLEKFIPKDHIWPIDDVWNYHAGLERFTNIRIFTDGLARRYGAPTSLDDYLRKAQAMTYDGERAMFEAYSRNKYKSTGVIQWMLNNGWPSLIWHLYDYYLVPAGGYFGTKKACEPIHVQYSWDDHSVAVVNSTYAPLRGMRVTAKVLNVDGTEKGSGQATIDVEPDSAKKAFDIAKIAGLSHTYFLRLEVRDSSGKLVSDNFYWLSTKLDTLDWPKRFDTVYTPQKDFADLTGLGELPQVKLEATAAKDDANAVRANERRRIRVTVTNPTKSVAFMVHLRATWGPGGDDATPILWEDNYFSLLPGESKRVVADLPTANTSATGAPNLEPVIELDGYNVTSARLNLAP